MNEEEIREAGKLENIVDIKYHLKQWKNKSEKGELDECHLVEEDIEIMELAVNIIEKQKAEYSDLKLKYEQNLRMCKHFREELNKQDKIIDEMAYYLSDFDIDEMCEKCDRCIGNGCYADDDMEFKTNCIKQYYERKVENGN